MSLNLEDPREIKEYTLLPRLYQGATPMMEALWTTVWINCRNANDLTWEGKKKMGPIIPIAPGLALSLMDKGVRWVHICNPRTLYNVLRRVANYTAIRDRGEHFNSNKIMIDIYEHSTLLGSHPYKYKILVNGSYVRNFMDEVSLEFNWKVSWNRADRFRCQTSCCKFILNDRQRGMITIQNLGRGINHD